MPINYSLMPNLRPEACRIASPVTTRYNCIAWAAGVDDEWWDPAQGYVWPADLPHDVSIETLVRVYERRGFVTCDDSRPVPGYEKIVIYGAYGEWEHAARQLDSGKWTSKMGPDEDIEHDSPQDLAGGAFGLVVRIMKRPTAALKQTPATAEPVAIPKQPTRERRRRKQP